MFLFENLIAYKKSIELTVVIYTITKNWPKTETSESQYSSLYAQLEEITRIIQGLQKSLN